MGKNDQWTSPDRRTPPMEVPRTSSGGGLSVCAYDQQLIWQFYKYSIWKLQYNGIEARLLNSLSAESTACHRQLPFVKIYD